MSKTIRERKEMENLFADPKFARQAWKSVGQAVLIQPAVEPITVLDKDGNETFNSQVERYSYNKLSEDIKELAKENRKPTELEMILHCQILKARTDTSAAVFVRDTLGGKPVDESKVDATVSNPYENLTDAELALLQRHREELAKGAGDNDTPHV